MGRKPIYTPDEKLNVCMSVLKAELTQSEIARRMERSQTKISKWLKLFTEAGMEGLRRDEQPPQLSRSDRRRQSGCYACRRAARPRDMPAGHPQGVAAAPRTVIPL